ncbi:MAG: hypothetical protein N3E42_07095, partial [Candidatus Bipolaricaulota bacterium]|nr:hypothetical protein [Candidatus Bipolaricaulota bacterium]
SENIMLQPTSLNGINGIDINDILSKIYTITINNPNIEKGKIYFYLDSKDENNMPFIPYNFLDSTNNIAWWKREENIKGNIIIFDFEKQLNNNNIIFTLNSIQEGGEGGIIPM